MLALKKQLLTIWKQWLPFVSAYRTMCLAPDADFRQLLEDTRQWKLAA